MQLAPGTSKRCVPTAGMRTHWPGWRRRLEICGEHGSIAIEDDHITRWEFREAQPGDAAAIGIVIGKCVNEGQ